MSKIVNDYIVCRLCANCFQSRHTELPWFWMLKLWQQSKLYLNLVVHPQECHASSNLLHRYPCAVHKGWVKYNMPSLGLVCSLCCCRSSSSTVSIYPSAAESIFNHNTCTTQSIVKRLLPLSTHCQRKASWAKFTAGLQGLLILGEGCWCYQQSEVSLEEAPRFTLAVDLGVSQHSSILDAARSGYTYI